VARIMTFATRVYRLAGIYGLIVLLPQYVLEAKNGRDYPPPITHPEYYYGFVGVAVAWQIAFLIISTDPVRYRPLMIAAMLEKATFFVAVVVLFTLGRVHLMMLGAASLDMVFGVLFAVAYAKTAGLSFPVRS
jgi:hypothetical protein